MFYALIINAVLEKLLLNDCGWVRYIQPGDFATTLLRLYYLPIAHSACRKSGAKIWI